MNEETRKLIYGCATDFSHALLDYAAALSKLLDFNDMPTMADVEAFEERARTYTATLRINAELADMIRAAQAAKDKPE